MKTCSNCIYRDLLITQEPCMDCIYGINWEGEEEEKEDPREDKISSKEFIKGFGG